MAQGESEADLELVAIATMADVVALRGENRRLVRAGLRALAGTTRPGLRALMRVARVAPLALDEQALAFRIAPRINAAGRLYRADAALELLLTDDDRARARSSPASSIAATPSDAASKRGSASKPRRWSRRGRPQPAAHVLAAAGWHPGVIGIVAARVAERHHRPVVLIALPEDGERARPAAPGARSRASTCSAG